MQGVHCGHKITGRSLKNLVVLYFMCPWPKTWCGWEYCHNSSSHWNRSTTV